MNNIISYFLTEKHKKTKIKNLKILYFYTIKNNDKF